MELCYKWRFICVAWCCIEIIFFGGIIYGWGSLVFVLKEEGFYSDVCDRTDAGNLSIVIIPTSVVVNKSETILDAHNHMQQLCSDQEAKLNLWFSIAVGFMYVGLAFLGQLTRKLGTRITRSIFICVYVCGTLCIAFSSPSHPWLLCPGLCCIGLAGLVMFATSIQVSNLFPTGQSTVVSIFCGLFDFSSIVQQIVKIAYENGIGLMYSYICLSIFSVAMFSVSTFVFLPRDYIIGKKKCPENEVEIPVILEEDANNQLLNHTPETMNIEKTEPAKKRNEEESLKSCFLSITYFAHVTWMSVNMLMFVTFIGLLNPVLIRLSGQQEHVVGHYLGAFAYTTMSSALLAVIAGIIYDWQRKRYSDEPLPSRKYKPVVPPMMLCQVFGVLAYALPLIGKLKIMFPVFVIFTFYRSFLYSIGIAFINEAFPAQHFGPLYGTMTFINGLVSMLQYGLFAWNEKYPNAYQHVTAFVLCIAVLAFIHPIQLWLRSGKRKKMDCKENNNSLLLTSEEK